MRILVVGAGKVGTTLAEHLLGEGHDVVVIDSDEEVLRRCEDTLDVMCAYGNGANAQTLIDAGVDHTDILIAATAGDEINMICCLIGKGSARNTPSPGSGTRSTTKALPCCSTNSALIWP